MEVGGDTVEIKQTQCSAVDIRTKEDLTGMSQKFLATLSKGSRWVCFRGSIKFLVEILLMAANHLTLLCRLDVYIYDYLIKRNLQASAKAFLNEGKVSSDPVGMFSSSFCYTY